MRWEQSSKQSTALFQGEFDCIGTLREGEMSIDNILFTEKGDAITPDGITDKIATFGYNVAVAKIIQYSKELDRDGGIFIKCTALILSNFKPGS